MPNEILINHTIKETRIARLINGVVQEIWIDRPKSGLLGNVYLGTVVRVLSGMQSAFVDIGQERTAFLHVDDVLPLNADMPKAPIEQRLRQGELVLVQVIKDEFGTKGARVTMNVTLPSRYLVALPYEKSSVSISSRLGTHAHRKQLKAKVTELAQMLDFHGGLIVRTLAEDASDDELMGDLYYLNQLWSVMTERLLNAKKDKKKHALIHQELPLYLRCLRDMAYDDITRIITDDVGICQAIDEFMPSMLAKVEHHTAAKPLFEAYGAEQALQDALNRRVDLPSGGYLMIDQTEAMTTIDVNTGSFVGKHTLNDTLYQTNLEAIDVIARQLRLRNITGIIIIDFIDMIKNTYQEPLMNALKNALKDDPTPTQVVGMSALGLVELTRKRTHESLSQQLCQPCPVCEGRGVIKTVETISFEIFRKLMSLSQRPIMHSITVVAHPSVIEYLQMSEQSTMDDLQALLNKRIELNASQYCHLEKFHLIVE